MQYPNKLGILCCRARPHCQELNKANDSPKRYNPITVFTHSNCSRINELIQISVIQIEFIPAEPVSQMRNLNLN